MGDYLAFALIGLGAGAVYSGLAIGLVVTYKGTGVINFAQGAFAMWGAFVYSELRSTGTLVLPVVGLPARVPLGVPLGAAPAACLGVLSATVLALLAHLLVFRPLRAAPALARVIASVGLMLTIEAVATIRFGSQQRFVSGFLPTGRVSIGGSAVPLDRFYLTLIALGLAGLLAAYFRFTRVGIATRAVAENPTAVMLAGRSAQLLAALSWALSGALAGLFGILIAPITGLNPVSYTLFVVPALAVAVVGRLQSMSLVCIGGIVLGAVQGEIVYLQTKSWYPPWAITGATDAVPFVVLIVALYFFGGRRLLGRGDAASTAMPGVGARPRLRILVPVSVGVACVGLVLLKGSYRFGLIESLVLATLLLSFVVLTGLLGQISFAQAAFAGTAGFLLSKLSVQGHVPFPFSMLIAAGATAVLGLIVGIPALRIRGVQLAVVTLATAVAVQRFVFDNPQLTPNVGNAIPNPVIGGLDLGIREGHDNVRIAFGLFALLVLTVVAIGVVNLTWSATGRRFLAIRSNERAAAAVGVNVRRAKLLGFAISSFIAGLGGAMLGYSRGELTASSFDVFTGITFLVFAYLGGVTGVIGALIAGLLAPLGICYVLLNRAVDLGQYYLLVSGLSVIAITIFNPQGIQGFLPLLRRRLLPVDPVAVPRAAAAHSGQRGSLAGGRLQTAVDQSQAVLDVKDMTVAFGGNEVLRQVCLRIYPGTVVGVIGPNGAGKTTLLDALTGFVPYSGQVLFDGTPIDRLAAHHRAQAGVIRTWQSIELFSELSVFDNLRVGIGAASLLASLTDLVRPDRGAGTARSARALARVGLPALGPRMPGELTLGQQKLVGVARALATDPKVLLMDEPAAGLDRDESREFGAHVTALAQSGLAIVLVEHDVELVRQVCDYVYVLDFGQVIARGSPAEVMRSDRVLTAYLGLGALAPGPAVVGAASARDDTAGEPDDLGA
ncbi:MAG: ABC transporter permease subunit [Jatrophihabitantaceae bacterium]